MEANLSPSKKRKQLVLDLVATLIVLLLALLVVLPIWWIFRSSLMSTAKLNEYPPSFIPHEWLWANYSKALETFEYWRYFRNTFSIIIPAVTFGTVTAIFCGYAFARLRFRGKKLISASERSFCPAWLPCFLCTWYGPRDWDWGIPTGR